jgi:O-antigen/teichoic acid export membrane protein
MRQVTRSVSALYFERAIRIASTFVTTVILARYLGPQNFGELSYALSLIAIFVGFASLGLDEILIRDSAAKGALQDSLAAVFCLRLAACAVLFPISVLVVSSSSSAPVIGITFIAALILLAPLYSFEQVLYAKMRGGRLAFLGASEILITLSFRLYLVFTNASTEWIMFSYFLEAGLKLALVSAYTLKSGLISNFATSASLKRATEIFFQGMPLLAANLAVIGYMKLDQIMLRTMVGAEEVAIYAVAVRITESFYFLPMILSTALLPVLTSARQSDRYTELFQRLYRQAFYSGLFITILILFSGSALIDIAFGAEYRAAGDYLKIYALGLPLVFLGVTSGKWLIIEGLQKHALFRTLLGLIVNISLNLILIPKYAGAGAAIATIFSQLVAAFLYDFLFKSTRPMGLQKCNIILFKKSQ